MTEPGFQAAPAAMRDAAEGIDALVGELGELTTAGRAGAGRGVAGLELDPDQVGHDELAGAVAAFCGRWEWGVRTLVRTGTDMAEGLRESLRAYEDTEGEIGATFSRLLTDAIGDPTADPEQAPRTGDELLRGLLPDNSRQSWQRSAESTADTWSELGRDVDTTLRDRIDRLARGEDPAAPELDRLRPIAD